MHPPLLDLFIRIDAVDPLAVQDAQAGATSLSASPASAFAPSATGSRAPLRCEAVDSPGKPARVRPTAAAPVWAGSRAGRWSRAGSWRTADNSVRSLPPA